MAAKNLWLRLYTEITRDRKLRRHPASIRWAWITIMCMAKVSPVPGVLLLSESVPVTLEDIADEAALDLSEVKEAVAIFARQDMLAEESGIYRLINWGERQFESDTSTDRVRRCRGQQSEKNETHTKRFRNVSETAPETETETSVPSTPEVGLIPFTTGAGADDPAANSNWEFSVKGQTMVHRTLCKTLFHKPYIL